MSMLQKYFLIFDVIFKHKIFKTSLAELVLRSFTKQEVIQNEKLNEDSSATLWMFSSFT